MAEDPSATTAHTPWMAALLARTAELFSDVPRPAHFTDHRHCCECAEHDATLQAHTSATIGYAELGTPAWDAISFTTGEGFRYYLPAMIRLALEGIGEQYYLDQWLFHLIGDGPRNRRWQCCSAAQRELVADVLVALLEHRAAEIDRNLDSDHLLKAIEIWRAPG